MSALSHRDDEELPLVSVLTPSFNQARWLADNLRSVAFQTYRRIEHIVMDGGSSDNSVDILREHSRPGLTWRSEKDRGQANALNRAFAASRGQIIGWLNSDDAYCDRRAVEWAVDTLGRNREFDVIYGYAILTDETNTVLQVIASPPFSRRLLRAVNYIYQPTTFIRREAIENQPYFLREDLEYVIDRELWFRLSPGHRFLCVRRPLAIDRHQRRRKVATAEYLDEARAFDEALGSIPSAEVDVVTSLVGLYTRIAGLLPLVLLPWSVSPAIRLRIPSLPLRFWRQVAVRRRFFPYGVDRVDVDGSAR